MDFMYRYIIYSKELITITVTYLTIDSTVIFEVWNEHSSGVYIAFIIRYKTHVKQQLICQNFINYYYNTILYEYNYLHKNKNKKNYSTSFTVQVSEFQSYFIFFVFKTLSFTNCTYSSTPVSKRCIFPLLIW